MYEIDTTQNYIIFAPANVVEEVLQNVRMILATIMTEVRYFNEFALDGSLLDKPLNLVQGQLTANAIRAIQKYETRFDVQEITFKGDPASGQIKPIIRGTINA